MAFHAVSSNWLRTLPSTSTDDIKLLSMIERAAAKRERSQRREAVGDCDQQRRARRARRAQLEVRERERSGEPRRARRLDFCQPCIQVLGKKKKQ